VRLVADPVVLMQLDDTDGMNVHDVLWKIDPYLFLTYLAFTCALLPQYS
jgi:hypothetical protein